MKPLIEYGYDVVKHPEQKTEAETWELMAFVNAYHFTPHTAQGSMVINSKEWREVISLIYHYQETLKTLGWFEDVLKLFGSLTIPEPKFDLNDFIQQYRPTFVTQADGSTVTLASILKENLAALKGTK
jgi:hypothetical protein